MKGNILRRILLITLILCQRVHAEEEYAEFMVDFRVNITRIDPNFSENESRIRDIVSFLREVENDSSRSISSVAFCGAASPEGSFYWNTHLAGARLAALERLIRREIEIPDSIITRDDSYIPWDYLREKVEKSNLPYRDTVLSIISLPPQLVKDRDNGKLVDHRITALKSLQGRKVWRDLFRRYFKEMRNASAVIITLRNDSPKILSLPDFPLSLNVATQRVEAEIYPLPSPHLAPCRRKPFYMAVYSNLLYDALALPNLGAEFYLGKNFSIAGNWIHAWWSNDRRHRFWRLYGGEINVRRWFGKPAASKPLTGHHLGIYAQAITFDFEFGGKAYMGGKPGGTILDRAHFGAGIEYGYSLPVGRRLNLDFTLGAGYIGGKIYEFHPEGDRYV